MNDQNTNAQSTVEAVIVPTAEQIKAAQDILAAAKKAMPKVERRGRPASVNNVSMTCVACQKKVTYRDCEADRIGLEKRIEKSGKTKDQFIASFNCRACARIARIAAAQAAAAAAPVVAMAAATVAPASTDTGVVAEIKPAKAKKAKKAAATAVVPVAPVNTEASVEAAAASLDAAIADAING
jgi:hypothetical protein